EETANKAAEGASKKPMVVEVESSSEESDSEDETESDEETIAESLRRRPAPISKDKALRQGFAMLWMLLLQKLRLLLVRGIWTV
ncbi:hypothetical protein A2U01_0078091, partial [Trifolium medium]|nr:hypothetical protein [Trifolium medium]